METISNIFIGILAAVAYCVASAIGFILWLLPIAIGFWIIGAVLRAVF